MIRQSIATIRLLVFFALVLSLSFVSGPSTSPFRLTPVHAVAAPVEPWYPAGPAFDAVVASIFADQNTEFVALQNGLIDLTDWPLTPGLITSLGSNPSFFVTSPIADHGYSEIEFHNGNNFWGCDFSFGDSACSIDIRQGISHLIDKNIFTKTQADIAGISSPIDVPVPPSDGLVSPNPCAWDPLFPETGSSCLVGAAGGLAYHLATATAGVGPSHPTFAWTPGLGTPDFCAAADHFILAGLATGKNPTTCVLTGINPTVTSHPINMYSRVDDPPRWQAGLSFSEAQCALFTGTFSQGCGIAPSSNNIISVTQGPVTGFTGFITGPTSVNQNWYEYTASFGSVFPFDNSLYYNYNSKFVSGIPSIQPPNGPCSGASIPSWSAKNYVYLCDPNYDSLTNQMEIAPCVSAAGDPSAGQSTPTFANCPLTSSLTTVSAGYQAEDRFGRGSYTIPLWSGSKNQFGYLSNWQRVVNHQGDGIPNFYTWLSAYSATPAQPSTIRQGLKEEAISLNPYRAVSSLDFFLLGNIYDSLGRVNPLDNN